MWALLLYVVVICKHAFVSYMLLGGASPQGVSVTDGGWCAEAQLSFHLAWVLRPATRLPSRLCVQHHDVCSNLRLPLVGGGPGSCDGQGPFPKAGLSERIGWFHFSFLPFLYSNHETSIPFSLTSRSRSSHAAVHVEGHAVPVYAEPQLCPEDWVCPIPRGYLRQAAQAFPGGASGSHRGDRHSAAHGGAVPPHTLSSGTGDNRFLKMHH